MSRQNYRPSSRYRDRTKTAARPGIPGGVPGRRRELIRLDTFTIRKKALAEYRKAELALALLKEQLKRYHEKDKPGFRSWLHQQFGSLLTRQRELEQAYSQKCALVFEIQELCETEDLSELEAYRKVMWRRAHPLEAEQEDRKREEEERKRSRAEFSDEDDDDSDFDWDTGGDRQDREEQFDSIPDDEWDEFAEFHETVTGRRPSRRARKEETQDGKSAKELYRTIVRRLHPDHHGAMSDARKNLWHEAQEAYRRRDVSALYNILARCDNGEAGLGHHSPVSLIQRLTAQLKKACQTTRREVGQLKRDVAWDYRTRMQNPRFSRQVKMDIEEGIRRTQADLCELEDMLAEFERRAERPARAPGKPRSKRRPRFDAQQEELF